MSARRLASDLAAPAFLLLATMLLGVGVLDAFHLFGRTPWLDEYHTLLIANRPGLATIFSDLAQGSDTNTPLLFLLLWPVRLLVGEVTPTALRVFTFGAVWLALVAVYRLLRQTFRPEAAFLGALAVWTHTQTVSHAFQGRFYAPWVLFTALYALAIPPATPTAPTPRRHAALAVTAALLCTIHYFGLFTWFLLTATALLASGGDWRIRVRRLAGALAGPVALLLCLPLLLGQRESISVATWVPPATRATVWDQFSSFLFWPPVVLCLLGWVVYRGILSTRGADARPVAGRWSTGQIALVGVGLLPFILVAFSLLVQSAIVGRYALPAVLLLAPIVAFAAEDLPRLWRYGLGALLLLSSVLAIRTSRDNWDDFAAQNAEIADTVASRATPGQLIVALDRATYYPLAQDPRLAGRHFVVLTLTRADMERLRTERGGTPANTDLILLETDLARVHERLYGFPKTATLDSIKGRGPILVIGREAFVGSFPARWMPEFGIRALGKRVSELTPPGSPP